MRRSHEFIATRDLYKEEPNEQGECELVLIKENLETRWLCGDLDRILEVDKQIFNGLTRVTLMGHSYGGAVCCILACLIKSAIAC